MKVYDKIFYLRKIYKNDNGIIILFEFSLIQQIKSIDAKGPYQLVGYSYGAMVAFEMACQLQKQQEKVSSLVLLDGSHQFFNLHTDIYRTSMKITSRAEEEAACLLAFVKIFTTVDDGPVSIFYYY